MRASKELKGHDCPGEMKCTTDKINGQIASIEGVRQKRTLENYCHDIPASKDNSLLNGCPLYATKPENVPQELIWAIETAETFKKYKNRGVMPPLSDFTAMEFACYDTAETVSDKLQAEDMEKLNAESSVQTNKNNNSNKQTPLGLAGEIEEGGIFSNW